MCENITTGDLFRRFARVLVFFFKKNNSLNCWCVACAALLLLLLLLYPSHNHYTEAANGRQKIQKGKYITLVLFIKGKMRGIRRRDGRRERDVLFLFCAARLLKSARCEQQQMINALLAFCRSCAHLPPPPSPSPLYSNSPFTHIQSPTHATHIIYIYNVMTDYRKRQTYAARHSIKRRPLARSLVRQSY